MSNTNQLKLNTSKTMTMQPAASEQLLLSEKIAKSLTKKIRPMTQGTFQEYLAAQANAPLEEDSPLEFAPNSPDPRFNHSSKLIVGIPAEVKKSEEELEKERARLRKQYLNNRAETVLFETKYGEIPQINYNEFC